MRYDRAPVGMSLAVKRGMRHHASKHSVHVYVIVTVIVALLALPAAAAEKKASIEDRWKAKNDRIMVMSHRGEHKKAPENTITAYEKAIEAGADIIEIDVRLTKDDHWIVYHNRVIPTSGGTRTVVSSLTYDVIKSLIISGKRHNLPDQHIPTLHEVLEALRGKALIYLDDKMGRPVELAEIVKQHKMEDQVIIGINDYADALLMSEFADGVAWRARCHPQRKILDKYLALKPKMIEINDVDALTPEIIDKIHRAGTKIMVNCLGGKDSNEHYKQSVVKVGADIVQTDNLDRLMAFLDGLETA